VLALAALALAPPAWAASPEQELANRYAPITALANQKRPCAKGEAWRPTTVDIVLGNPEVDLHGPGKGNPVVTHAPTAADLYGKGKGYFLNFPGNPLRPGCKFDRDGKRYARGRPSIAYAHIVTRRGDEPRLALQYWFFWYFNDFNDLHEADWEGIQLVFDVGSAPEALGADPVDVGYAQHGGGERTEWESRKLERVGNHPVVYSAAGSHASYYSTALWLGTSASEGFGCDDTREPSDQKPLGAVLMPSRVDSRNSPFAWLAFEGRWGQKERGANNGPSGPNTKSRWTDPFTWQDDLRSRSVEVPVGESIGQSVTGAFCTVVAYLSSVLNDFYDSPPATIAVLASSLALFLALLIWLIRRTIWSPPAPEPLRARRGIGQILRASRRIYWRRGWLFLGLGLLSIVIAVVVETLEGLLEAFFSLFGEVTLEFSTTAFGALAVNAAVAVALHRLESGRTVRVFRTWRFVARRFLTLLGAVVLELVLVVAVAIVVFGSAWLIGSLTDSPSTARAIGIVGLVVFGVWFARNFVGWLLTPQEIYIDQCSARAAVRGGPRLVENNWWRSAVLIVILYALGLAAGPIVGFVVLLLTSIDPDSLNLIGSAVYVIVFPYIAIATTLLYFDLKERGKEAVEPAAAGEAVIPSAV
jgi:hypothetical protein